MKNYVKNKFKDRLTYCKDWKNSIDLYLENKEITSKTNQEFYKSRPFLKIILDVYLSLIHISEPTRRTPISYAVFCLKKSRAMMGCGESVDLV